jgi:hypothetical protein
MHTYRVTYTDAVLREVLVKANDAEHAERLVREQIERAEHHHAVDAWTDDWQAERYASRDRFHRRCFECGSLAK